MKRRRLKMMEPDEADIARVCRELGCSRIMATVLANRKLVSGETLHMFLHSTIRNIRAPFKMKDMGGAVERIYKAVTTKERILIFGDYDVDGITATVVLYDFFRHIGANVSYYIPHRVKEGYGLQIHHVYSVFQKRKAQLVITVDCGSSSHDAIKSASQAGIDIIVTDHHEIGAIPSEAVAVINPKRADCPSGLDHLAGVGVAFYVLICLRKYLREHNFWTTVSEPNLKDKCDLVALGTIADIVPLTNENRIFAKVGMEVIRKCRRPGLQALLNSSKIDISHLKAEDIAYILAPKLNAPGRLSHAKETVELLTAESVTAARPIAQLLESTNKKRQVLEKTITTEILAHLEKYPHLLEKKTIVLANRNWHEGVLGIVASKIVRRFIRPVVLIAVKDGIGKGSARSIEAFDLYHNLHACADVIDAFGGHAMAAGLRLKEEYIPRFQYSFEIAAQSKLENDDLVFDVPIDYEITFDDITGTLLDELQILQPFGTLNQEPIFLAKNVQVTSSSIVGGHHRRMTLYQPNSRMKHRFPAIQFNADMSSGISNDFFEEAVFKLQWNHYNGTKKIQLLMENG